ncbi:MAG: NAD(P)/FAD-dependent oxidoreductase [Oscillibacter sp.]
MNKKIVVIGGGAAGMMAAICAAEQGAQVTLLEPNERLGKKLNITGKGRCNVTNDSNCEELLANVPRNGKFLYSAFSHFDGKDTMAFFQALGVPVKVERGRRVFPVSDRSFDISSALERRLRTLGVDLVQDRAVSVTLGDEAVSGVAGERGNYPAQAVILATGGVSYPSTGSTGDGYRIAAETGHDVTPLQGSLVPLEGVGTLCQALQGLSLRNVSLTVFEEKKKIYTDFGELLFTHFGVSGPLILSASAHMRHFGTKNYHLEIDLKPALDEQALDKRLLSDFEKYANSDFGNALGDLLPQKMISVVIVRSKIPARQKVHDLTREQRHELLYLLKHFPVEIAGPRPVEDAIVTSGGVKVNQIDPKTMASKLVKGMYFAGEIIDTDAYTGGFNLQIAWATGRAAGLAAAQEGETAK